MGAGYPGYERVWFVGDDGPALIATEHLNERLHCPGLLKALQDGAAAHWQKGHDDGVRNAMEGLKR